MSSLPSLSATELDRTNFPVWRDGILDAEANGDAQPGQPRSYPGYPAWPLPHVRPRVLSSLDRALKQRRCRYPLGKTLPSPRKLSRLLGGAHGISGAHSAGPTPSAGGLQALELYLAVWQESWLPAGIFHYDRANHHLAQITAEATRDDLAGVVPSLGQLDGGALLFVLVGDAARVTAKYGERGVRFLLLEAGHLMQNLCLLSQSVGLVMVPLGGFFERDLARRLDLLDTDVVLYLGACG